MAQQQIKFYSVASLPELSKINQNGIYFKAASAKTGELYKGAVRFGGGRVTEVANIDAAPTDAVQGDIIMCSVGGAYAYDGAKWVTIGPDISQLRSDWRSDIKDWTSGLVAGGNGSIITGITQATDGKVTATAIAFPTIGTGDADGQVKFNGVNATVSGWGDLTGRVDDIEGIVDAANSKVTADTAEFKDLTVSQSLVVSEEDSATFGGNTISAIADRQALAKIAAISEASASASAVNGGVVVGVTTQSGSVKDVTLSVNATASAADIKTDADNGKLARAKDVADAIAGLTGAMHFIGVKTELPATANNGDIVIVKTTEGTVTITKEYVYSIPEGETEGTWVQLGDEALVDKIATFTGLGTTLTTTATTLAGAVNELDAAIKGMDADLTSTTDAGVSTNITQVDGKITAFGVSVAAISASSGVVTGETKVVTAGSVADYVTGVIGGLDASVSASNKGVAIEVVEADGKLTSASVSVTAASEMTFGASEASADVLATTAAVKSFFDNNMVWLDADGEPVEEE